MNSCPYEVLKVPYTASNEDIKKAYNQLVMKHHPDRGGIQTDFIRIQEAYEVLMDPVSRQKYNVQKNIHSMLSAVHTRLFSFFNTTSDLYYDLHVTLDEVYSQNTKTVTIPIQIDGISHEEICICTLSNKTVTNNKTIVKHRGNKQLNMSRGNIVINTIIKSHNRFHIMNENDLKMILDISLVDALTKDKFIIEFLCNELIVIQPQCIITPNYLHIVRGKGKTSNGNLYCYFNIIFPSNLTVEQKTQIYNVLNTTI